MLWDAVGGFCRPALELGLANAQVLAASTLKMSIGGFNTASASTLKEFGDCLAQTSTHLLIENDQTVSAGTLPALQRFFESLDGAGLSVGMTRSEEHKSELQ